ncbi:hypothetical protein BGZ80_001687 [Entomortierella chlamydospora]|uniref:Nascent polypeptide-associated complex subunit beta n=1 Tax=Entomortierella chlamydospora TaxID=101097 RepID=A0A9P6SXL7_9FUNG|nr:hypothetical protein BGZ80_001687 [Entomortierella chlamydospora]
MFDIPELDDMICPQLRRRDLAQCSRVSKQWCKVVARYLWKDITNLKGDRRAAFCRIVHEDYLQEQERQKQQRQQQQEQKQQEQGQQQQQEQQWHQHQNLQAQGTQPLSPLAKYARWIRKIPSPSDLLEYFERSYYLLKLQQFVEPATLMHHLLNRCSSIEIENLTLETESFKHIRCWKLTTEFFLPHVRHLILGRPHYNDITQRIEPSRFKVLWKQCSDKLEKLTLSMLVLDKMQLDDLLGIRRQERTEKIKLKDLALARYRESPALYEFWSWLWARCNYLEILRLHESEGSVRSLARGMIFCMPNLCRIQFGGRDDCNGEWLTDKEVAFLLRCCRNRWKTVEVRHNVEFQRDSVDALAKHYPTLEEFIIDEGEFNSDDIFSLLSSSHNLQTLSIIDDVYSKDWKRAGIESSSFIDLDLDGSLKKWPCEGTLKILKVWITKIPRPDLGKQYGVIEEKYPGQGRKIQNQVYERLARFTKLEKLWLGSECYNHPGSESYHDSNGLEEEQRDCLEMSLESGLHKLGGLKELRELSLSYMNVRVGLKEVKWMVEHWPKLRFIRLLDYEEQESDSEDSEDYEECDPEECDPEDGGGGDNGGNDDEDFSRREFKEIASWMQENYPEIEQFIHTHCSASHFIRANISNKTSTIMNPEKLAKLQANANRSKGTPRRVVKKVHRAVAQDDRKLQAALEKLSLVVQPYVEEVNFFMDDGSVTHFRQPKVHVSHQSNTYAIYGRADKKDLTELFPGILSQLGPDSLDNLRRLAQSYQQTATGVQAGDDDDEVPDLVESFEDTTLEEKENKEGEGATA